MKIVVCIKQVPETANVKIDPKTNTIIREGVSAVLNPFDEFAVEEAMRIKEKFGGDVTVVTMGPAQARDALLKCLAMGADRAIHLCDIALAGSDTLATAYALAQAIKGLSYDLVLCGKQAIDGDTAQVGPELAERLGIPAILGVKKVEVDPDRRTVRTHRETEEGYEVLECNMPALLTAIKGLNEPRLPTLKGIMGARNKEIRLVTALDLGVSKEHLGLEGSATWVSEVFVPQIKHKCMMIRGDDPEAAAKELVNKLIDIGMISR